MKFNRNKPTPMLFRTDQALEFLIISGITSYAN